MKKYALIIVLFLLYAPIIKAQSLPSFTLNTTTTPEICGNDGTVTFSVTGNDPSATMIFNIYDANNNLFTSTQEITYSTLPAGSYSVTAIQSRSGYISDSSTKQFTIADNKQPPVTFTLSVVTPPTCPNENNGSITVNVTSGNAVSYMLASSNGGNVVGPQSSNVFNNLTEGDYLLTVTDKCKSITQSVALRANNFSTIVNGYNYNVGSRTSCDSFPYIAYLYPDRDIRTLRFPINIDIKTTINNNTTPQDNQFKFVLDSSIINSPYNYLTVTYNLHYDEGGNYAPNITVTDACDSTIIFTTSFENTIMVYPSIYRVIDCYNQYIVINNRNLVNPTFKMLSAPAAYTGSMNVSTTNNTFGDANDSVPIPYGVYKIQVKDSCGFDSTLTIDVEKPTNNSLGFQLYSSCDSGMMSFIAMESPFNSVISQFKTEKITSAPDNFPYPLPYDLSKNVTADSFYIVLNNVPGGTYTIEEANHCNEGDTSTITIQGYDPGKDSISAIPACNSFNVYVSNNTIANAYSNNYYLQKYYPEHKAWSSPYGYSNDSSSNPTINQNAIQLYNIGLNTNFGFSGDFRVMRMHYGSIDTPSLNLIPCIDSLYAFTYNVPKSLSIKNVYGLPCPNGIINVNVTAQDGYPPYNYSIIQKDDSSYYVNNGSNGLFQNLPKGIYTFVIVDSCGNSISQKFEVTKLDLPKIETLNICDGQAGKLSLPVLPLTDYKWWKGNNPANIISTLYYYDFAPFNIATDTGTYYAVMASTTGSGCIADTMSIHISSNLLNPNAGNDTTVYICRTTDMLNLLDLLSPDADKNGTWNEISNSNLLADHYWFPSSAVAGTYRFEYIAEGLCSGADTSLLTIITADTPSSIPIVSNIINQSCTSDGSAQISNLPSAGTWIISLNDSTINGTGSSYLLSGLSKGSDTIQVGTIPIPGCSSGKAFFDVPFTDDLNLAMTGKTSDTICYGNSSNISAQTNGTQILWTPATGLSNVSLANPVASPPTSTIYYITSTLGICTQTDSVSITVNPLPIAVVGNDTSICPGQNTQLSGSGGISSEWSPSTFLSDETRFNPDVIQPTQNITYSLKVTDTNGCTSSNIAQTRVNLYPPVVIAAQSPPPYVSVGDELQMQVTDVNNVGIADYLWSPPDGLSDIHTANPELTVGNVDSFTVTATSKDGCYGTAGIFLTIVAKPDLFIPSAFTPNGDRTNDIFKPIPVSIKEIVFAVYNRYGNKLYETHELNKGWDGTYNGIKQPVGTYVWYAEAVSVFNDKIVKRGTVVLIR